jgi:hypothetical protein
VRITDASDFGKGGRREHLRITTNYDVANSNSVFGELIDNGFEVIRRPNKTNSIDGASDHFRAIIQYGHNPVEPGRIGSYEFDIEQGQAV